MGQPPCCKYQRHLQGRAGADHRGGKKSKKGLAAVGLPELQKAMEALGHDQAAFRQTLLGLR